MPVERKRKVSKKMPTRRKNVSRIRFDPDLPFAEGVRGAESFLIQNGLEFPRQGLFPKGNIDG